MEAVPKIKRPKQVHTTDQIVAQAARLGWTVGITNEDLVGAQYGAAIGLHAQDEKWPIEGMKHMSRNGLRYPIPQFGIQQDVRSGLEVSIGKMSSFSKYNSKKPRGEG